jgi:DNA primase
MDLETLKEEVRARADIVDIIGRSVRLQKSSGAWKGLCPFHQEKSPSFHVNPRRQSYHCFGCGVGGDVFKFVMEYEHLDFMATLEKLANQFGVPFELDGRKGDGNLKRRLLELHEKTSTWFETLLHEDAIAQNARAYLAQRELEADTPKTFRLGYAPNSNDLFLKRATDWGFTPAEIEASGLVGVSENNQGGSPYYDRFRNRLMFPILDEQARVIGFSGRAIPPGEVKAKYLNSPETMLFKKSRVLYGIDKARQTMAEKRRAVLCEGQLDVIRCHESGITEAVAAQGTAITEDHAHILKRYADEVILLLDADTAGVKAALRSAEVLLASGLSVNVSSLPEGEDPDDLVRKYGPKRLREVVESADPFVLFQVRTLVRQEGEITETSRLRVARKVMETVAHVKEAVHREELIRQAAEALGMREDALRQDIRPVQADFTPSPKQKSWSSKAAPQTPKPRVPVKKAGALPTSEKLLLEFLLAYPDQILPAGKMVAPRHLSHPDCRMILEAFYSLSTYTHQAIMDMARDHEKGDHIFALDPESRMNVSEEMGTPENTLKELVVIVRREELTRKQKALQEESKTASADARASLEPEIWRLQNLLGQLKECYQLKNWEKAGMLMEMIDLQDA